MVSAEGSKPETIESSGQNNEALFSPRFRSVAAMAGWDEEALLFASLIVEDTPDRQFKHRKRSDLQSFQTPSTNSSRKRRAQRMSPVSKPVEILDLDGDGSSPKQENEKTNEELNSTTEAAEGKRGEDEVSCKSSSVSISTAAAIPCIDKLREELSCAICLEICYEPSTTPCGHSFCKKCLRSAADKCGKRCPKCRQLVSNGRYCTVNTVLWNTIQLLFPQDVEARKNAAAASASADGQERTSPPARSRRNRAVAALNSPESGSNGGSRRQNNQHHHQRQRHHVRSRQNAWPAERRGRELPSQDEDAALALRLQREEFLEVFNHS